MTTPLGIFLKDLRRKNNFELLEYMAKKLDISPSELSAYESGKEIMPEDLARNLSLIYGLSPALQKELFRIIHDAAVKKEE